MQFHLMTVVTTPEHMNLYPGGHDICNFGKPLLGHHYNLLSLTELCAKLEKIFKRIMHFYLMT